MCICSLQFPEQTHYQSEHVPVQLRRWQWFIPTIAPRCFNDSVWMSGCDDCEYPSHSPSCSWTHVWVHVGQKVLGLPLEANISQSVNNRFVPFAAWFCWLKPEPRFKVFSRVSSSSYWGKLKVNQEKYHSCSLKPRLIIWLNYNFVFISFIWISKVRAAIQSSWPGFKASLNIKQRCAVFSLQTTDRLKTSK